MTNRKAPPTRRALAAAIVARVDGVFDHPDLEAWGPLSTTADDVVEMARAVLQEPEPPLVGTKLSLQDTLAALVQALPQHAYSARVTADLLRDAVAWLRALSFANDTLGSLDKECDQGNIDCLAKRRPGEPIFILMGRDPDAARMVRLWANRRRAAGGDPAHCDRAWEVADSMLAYAADPANAPSSAPPKSAYPDAVFCPDTLEADLDQTNPEVDWALGVLRSGFLTGEDDMGRVARLILSLRRMAYAKLLPDDGPPAQDPVASFIDAVTPPGLVRRPGDLLEEAVRFVTGGHPSVTDWEPRIWADVATHYAKLLDAGAKPEPTDLPMDGSQADDRQLLEVAVRALEEFGQERPRADGSTLASDRLDRMARALQTATWLRACMSGTAKLTDGEAPGLDKMGVSVSLPMGLHVPDPRADSGELPSPPCDGKTGADWLRDMALSHAAEPETAARRYGSPTWADFDRLAADVESLRTALGQANTRIDVAVEHSSVGHQLRRAAAQLDRRA